MIRKIAGIYRQLKRQAYLIFKLIPTTGNRVDDNLVNHDLALKQLVVYTKKHPIYTSIFEDTLFYGFEFVYLDFSRKLTWLERKLLLRAKIIHFDAANFDPKNVQGKLVVVECEGYPGPAIMNNPVINKLYIESKAAAAGMYGHPKLELMYPAVKPQVYSSLASHNNRPIMLTAVGYGSFIKGFDVVFKIYEALKTRYPVKLIIAGTFGHNFDWYPEITREAYDNAGFPGMQQKIASDPNVEMGPKKRNILYKKVYPETDIYLHFSRMETFGYSILEAMSFGLPVVATHIRAIPEMVEHRVNGILVNDNSFDINSKEWFDSAFSEGLAAVTELIENPVLRKQMGGKSYEKSVTVFNLEKKKEMLQKEYSRLIKEREQGSAAKG